MSEWLLFNRHTKDYSRYAEKLRKSVNKLGIPLEMGVMPRTGNWREMCLEKPVWLREALDLFPGVTVVWVDADTEFKRLPPAFDNPSHSVMLVQQRGIDLDCPTCSITLARNDDDARYVLDRWIANSHLSEPGDNGDEAVIRKLLRSDPSIASKVGVLPAEYASHPSMRRRQVRNPVCIMGRAHKMIDPKYLERGR